MDAFVFPPEFVNPATKQEPWYGVAYAKAAYYSNNTYGARISRDDTEFRSLIEIAQGRQSVDGIKRLFGFFQENQIRGVNDGPASLTQLDPQILNLAPKYINRAVAKMQRANYDIGLDAIDIVSMDEKADYGAVIKSYYRFKEWVQSMGVPLQAVFQDIDVASLPKYPDELMYDLNTNPKVKKEISGELALQLVMAMNNFKQKMREVDWDMVVIGRGHLHCYLDVNNFPRIERIDPKYWGGSYVDNDDFEQQEYAYFLDCITVNQFIREASPFYKPEEVMAIARKYAIRNSSFQTQYASNRPLQNNWDNLNYMPVMRFYFRSEDNKNYVKTKNQYGSTTFMERSFDYHPSPETLEKVQQGKSKIINNTYTSIYGGTWILDSDVVYNYGMKKTPRTNLVEASIPIKTFATNFKDGRSVSFTSQIIEPLFMINVAHNKIKEILAKEWIGLREIDFNQIENVALGRGGRQWSAREVYEFMSATNTLVKRGATSQYQIGNEGGAIKFHNTGVLLTDYFNTIQMYINILEQMTGTTLVESSEKQNRLAVGVMQASQFAGDLDMEYLYNGHEYLYQRTAHQLLLLTQEALRNKTKISGYLPALGKVNTGVFDVPEDIAYCDYGMRITRQPTAEEWAAFYTDIQIALKDQRIGPADSAFVREIDNLKQARMVLANREILYQRQLQQEKQLDIQTNMQANSQAAQLKAEMEFAKIEKQKNADAELIILKGQVDQMLQREQSERDSILNGMTNQMKENIAKQTGIDAIMKQGIKNLADFERARSQERVADKNNQAKAAVAK